MAENETTRDDDGLMRRERRLRQHLRNTAPDAEDDLDALLAPDHRADNELRGRVEALANGRGVLWPDKFKFGASENYVAGYQAARADLRALLDEVES